MTSSYRLLSAIFFSAFLMLFAASLHVAKVLKNLLLFLSAVPSHPARLRGLDAVYKRIDCVYCVRNLKTGKLTKVSIIQQKVDTQIL